MTTGTLPHFCSLQLALHMDGVREAVPLRFNNEAVAMAAFTALPNTGPFQITRKKISKDRFLELVGSLLPGLPR